LDTKTALIYDAVNLFATALQQYNSIQVRKQSCQIRIRENMAHYFQDISVPSLRCFGGSTWNHGSSLINYMKLAQIQGLSGKIQFDAEGLRTQFQLEVVELQQAGLESVGEREEYL